VREPPYQFRLPPALSGNGVGEGPRQCSRTRLWVMTFNLMQQHLDWVVAVECWCSQRNVGSISEARAPFLYYSTRIGPATIEWVAPPIKARPNWIFICFLYVAIF
jgi:hypothetical protein